MNEVVNSLHWLHNPSDSEAVEPPCRLSASCSAGLNRYVASEYSPYCIGYKTHP